ncbi:MULTISPECIES: GtrA family protein [unclassified Chelatococcus]|uniref:GtrA family protein n=1 Tax=unclassified Chelatococcus TaxID=2638111 RepID=UPI001BCF29A7|nr:MULTISPECIES: GtrA family protein [unclassified Chelatococcus]MBS7697815.1 GtrA family protein [Chelatococcus sp. YT9]MBX3381848.1 GtrA family protein [Phycisphaeraceae bacterium]MBX3559754.1 GtrA family protein [Chelatococcus sp.]
MSDRPSFIARHAADLSRQVGSFVVVGLLAAVAHFGTLIGLVEHFGLPPVPATLIGFIAGGIVSYILNRSMTFASRRPHREASWRFAVVASGGFGLTFALMYVFIHQFALPYLPAQVVTTGIVLVWNFLGNKLWTFGAGPV